MLKGNKVLGVVALALVLGVACFAADANAPAPEQKTTKVQGTVSAVKDANSVVTAITLKTKEGTVYSVELDKKGLELAAMAGKEVEVNGVASKKDGKDCIKVLSAKLVEKAEKPAA